MKIAYYVAQKIFVNLVNYQKKFWMVESANVKKAILVRILMMEVIFALSARIYAQFVEMMVNVLNAQNFLP